MKVRELIELLKSAPQEAKVLIEHGCFQLQREVEDFYVHEGKDVVLYEQERWACNRRR
jgi:hypothetical protein